MPNDLRSTLSALAQTFADSVLGAIRSASLDDLVADIRTAAPAPRRESPVARPAPVRANGPARPAPAAVRPAPKAAAHAGPARVIKGPLPRRSPAQVAKTLGDIVALLKTSKTGMRSEEIRDALRLDKREMPRVLKDGLAAKKLRSKGVKRSTTYSAT